ncbi:hypothetical protein ACIQKB_04070 [Streptomyces sp. NPDC092046]|uniref:hypothetical protein n=1 Tax=Streptomyces sp. NPDC092046 TaxID=3366009 RepID=UPI003813AEBB
MSTTVSASTCGNTSATPLTPARLLSAPLPVLLAEANAEIVDSSIRDTEFFGAAVQRRGEPIRLLLPTGRSARERDTMVRMLVGRLVGAELKPLPASLEARTYGGAL